MRPLRLTLLFVFIMVPAALAVTVYQIMPDAAELERLQERATEIGKRATPRPTTVLDRRGRLVGRFLQDRRIPVTRTELPDHLIAAFLQAEDRDFYEHRGFSLRGMLRALFVNIRKERLAQGGSTLTQQLARSLFLNREKTFSRKLREIILAVFIERQHSKDEILVAWMNQVFLGNHSHGVGAAARNYFRKAVRDLNPGESVLLAALPVAPTRLALHRNLPAARRRALGILRGMVRDGHLTAAEGRLWSKRRVRVMPGPAPGPRETGWVMDHVRRRLARKLAVFDPRQSGLLVHTSLDLEALRLLTGIAEDPGPDLESAVLAIDPANGGILALRGGRDYRRSVFDRNRWMARPAAAMVLPFLYAGALDQGLDLTSGLYGNGKGPPLIAGLLGRKTRESARLLSLRGTGTAAAALEKWGLSLKGKDPFELVTRFPITPLRLVRAYQILAAGGVEHPLWMIRRVEDDEGRVLYERRVSTGRQVADLQTTWLINYAQGLFAQNLSADLPASVRAMAATASGQTDGWLAVWHDRLLLLHWQGTESGQGRVSSSAAERAGGLLAGLRSAFARPVSGGWYSAIPPAGIRFVAVPPGRDLDPAIRSLPVSSARQFDLSTLPGKQVW